MARRRKGPIAPIRCKAELRHHHRECDHLRSFRDNHQRAQIAGGNFSMIALIMLVTIVSVYVALGPTGFSLR